MINYTDAADTMRDARHALLVLDWVNNSAHKTGLAVVSTMPEKDSVSSALRGATALPGVTEFILQALKDRAEAVLLEAEEALKEYALFRDKAAPPFPAGFSGIDGA